MHVVSTSGTSCFTMSQQRRERLSLHYGNVRLVLVLWIVQRSIPPVIVQLCLQSHESSGLDTGTYIQGHRRKERFHLNRPNFIFMTRSQNTSTDTLPTSEDDMLKLLNLPEHIQTWTRFAKRAKTYRTTSSSGPSWETVVARITIDDKTGHILSLEYKKHMIEKDLHRNLPSVRDIRTLLLHFSIVTPNQQLKQSFQAFAALPVDETNRLKQQCRMNCLRTFRSDCERFMQISHFVSCES